jgi:hypothetical protein
MVKIKQKILLILLINLVIISVNAQFEVKKFGATGDGKTLDTKSIQSAIDKAFANGGGTVEVTPGTYLIGTLVLKDNVGLHLQSGSILLGSTDYKDYTEIIHKFESRTNGLYAKYFMVFAEGAKNISITGQGTMHGNGLKNFQKSNPQNQRPFMVRLVNCENVLIRDIYLLESANWTLHLLGCRDVNIDGVVIENGVDSNRDGLDIDCCERVTVANCRFSTGDDAIVMKASSDVLCQDITITNCIIRTRASAIKTGTESNGGFKNITVSNCIVKDIPRHAGIELMTVDGGPMENILLDNITMENVATPIFIRVGIRVRPYKAGQYVTRVDDVKDIFLNNITVVNATLPSSIMGLHNRKIENVVISNYTVRNSKAQVPTAYNKIPFLEFDYPAAVFFEKLPAYGLYCRNVDGLNLQNVFATPADNDFRPAFGFDRVNNLELFAVKAGLNKSTTPLAHLRNSSNIVASFCRTTSKTDLLFEFEENGIENMNLSGNILQPGQKEFAKVPALKDDNFFEDFKTELKYSVESGESTKGLTALNLKTAPLKFNMNMNKRGSLQICLLTLNESVKPAKVLIKYQGITQEFTIDWNEWGWAPVTLIKEYPADEKVDFEIRSADTSSDLKIAKVYFRYQDVKKTD